jgi:hypothetical protein
LENLIEAECLPTEIGYPIFLELLKLSKEKMENSKREQIKEKIANEWNLIK